MKTCQHMRKTIQEGFPHSVMGKTTEYKTFWYFSWEDLVLQLNSEDIKGDFVEWAHLGKKRKRNWKKGSNRGWVAGDSKKGANNLKI